MFVVPIQTYILIYKKMYEHWGVAGTLTRTHSQQIEAYHDITRLNFDHKARQDRIEYKRDKKPIEA